MVTGNYAFDRVERLEEKLGNAKELLSQSFTRLQDYASENGDNNDAIAMKIRDFFKSEGEDPYTFQKESFVPSMKDVFLLEMSTKREYKNDIGKLEMKFNGALKILARVSVGLRRMSGDESSSYLSMEISEFFESIDEDIHDWLH